MKILPFTEASLSTAADIIRRGGVVLLPTETVYGVACSPAFPKALERIRKMKARDATKPFQLLASDTDAVLNNGAVVSNEAQRIAASWPGALTLVLPQTSGPDEGYRIPNLPLLRQLIAQCGGLLRCTSVNLSGEPPAKDAQEAAKALPDADLLLDGGPARLGEASTVVRMLPDGTPQILRQGALQITSV